MCVCSLPCEMSMTKKMEFSDNFVDLVNYSSSSMAQSVVNICEFFTCHAKCHKRNNFFEKATIKKMFNNEGMAMSSKQIKIFFYLSDILQHFEKCKYLPSNKPPFTKKDTQYVVALLGFRLHCM